jgi:phosphatidylinositol alpha-1,6-mannosyltransferase
MIGFGKKRGDEILLVSKPLAPPWNDSGKVYVRDLALALPRRRFRALVPKGTTFDAPHVSSEPLYGDAGTYSPGLSQNARVLLRLLKPDRSIGLFHFFFAPNPKSSYAARAACFVTRKPSVQTVLSAPTSFAKAPSWLFGDRVVVLSEHTKAQLATHGFDGAIRIYPGVRIEPPVSLDRRAAVRRALDLESGPIVLYPGDLEHSEAARTVVVAAHEILRAVPKAQVVLACRPKTPQAAVVETRLREIVHGEPRVRFAGEVDDMRALLATSAVVVLPAETTYAKSDLPLVLLEALAEGVPIIVADRPPIVEVLQGDVGLRVPPAAPGALAAAVRALLADDVRRTSLGRSARTVAEACFSAETMARAYDRVYGELMGE